MYVRVGLWRKLSAEKLMLLNCGVGEDSWESLGLQGDPASPSWRRSVLGVHWKDWCWSWNSNTLANSFEELTHWKRPFGRVFWEKTPNWEGLGAGGEVDDRGWDGWMASPTRWAWVWVNSRSLWWTERPGMLRFMGSQSVGHDWVTELNWSSEIRTWYHKENQQQTAQFLPSPQSPCWSPLPKSLSGRSQFPLMLRNKPVASLKCWELRAQPPISWASQKTIPQQKEWDLHTSPQSHSRCKSRENS